MLAFVLPDINSISKGMFHEIGRTCERQTYQVKLGWEGLTDQGGLSELFDKKFSTDRLKKYVLKSNPTHHWALNSLNY